MTKAFRRRPRHFFGVFQTQISRGDDGRCFEIDMNRKEDECHSKQQRGIEKRCDDGKGCEHVVDIYKMRQQKATVSMTGRTNKIMKLQIRSCSTDFDHFLAHADL